MVKWYEGLSKDDALTIISRLAHNSVAHFLQNEKEESVKLFEECDKKAKELIENIVDSKSFYYGTNNYEFYEDFQIDVNVIVSSMKRNISNIAKEQWKKQFNK